MEGTVFGFNEEQNINIVKLIIDIIARIMREEPEYRRVLKTDVKNINLKYWAGSEQNEKSRFKFEREYQTNKLIEIFKEVIKK